LVDRPLRPLRRPVLRGGRPLRSDYGRAWPRVRVSAADPREGEGRRDGGRCHDAADGDPWHRLSTGGDRLSHGGATGPEGPHRVCRAHGDGPPDSPGPVCEGRPATLGHVHRLDRTAAAPDCVEDHDVVRPAFRRPTAYEPVRPRMVRTHGGTAEAADGPRGLVAVIAVHAAGMRRRTEEALRAPATAVPRNLSSRVPVRMLTECRR